MRAAVFLGYIILGILLFLFGKAETICAQSDRNHIEISEQSLDEQSVYLGSNVRFLTEFDSEAIFPEFDDSKWPIKSYSSIIPPDVDSNWQGEAMFRVHLSVDSAMFGKLVLLKATLSGAAQFWLNGIPLKSLGSLETDSSSFSFSEAQPSFVFNLDHERHQLLVIHFQNPDFDFFHNRNSAVRTDFFLFEPHFAFSNYTKTWRFVASIQWFFVGFCGIIGLLHLLFFLFNRKLTFNLWFAALCLLFGFGTFANQQWIFFQDAKEMVLLQSGFQSAMAFTLLFMAMFMRSIFQMSFPTYFKTLIGWITLVGFWNLTGTMPNPLLILSALIISIEIIIIALKAIRQKKKGVWEIVAGILLFIASIFLVITLESSGYQVQYGSFSWFHAPYIGFSVSILGMSFYQSRHLGWINLRLTQKLEEVKTLSEQNLAHERSISDAKIKQALLEKENERQADELDKARNLQLSLLPKKLPERENLVVHAEMITASEVGGDYYDVLERPDGSIIWAVGDATGHGTEAGIVAAMTKSLFVSLGPSLELDECLRTMSASLKDAGLKQKYMCLGMLKMEEHQIHWCSAGIPAVFVVRKDSTTGEPIIESLLSKGMPLGSVKNFPYQIISTSWNSGDMLLICSDGIEEQKNEMREEFGDERMKEIVRNHSASHPKELIEALKKAVEIWRGTESQADDFTFVGIRKVEKLSNR